MLLYRLTLRKFAGDLSGLGAKRIGGRWNNKGTPMLYCCSSISLCTLELAAHSGGLMQLKNLAITCIELDDKIKTDQFFLGQLPMDWQNNPAPESTKKLGTNWVNTLSAVALMVPSCIVPREKIYLLNPLHPLFYKHVSVNWIEPFNLDQRILTV